MHRGYFMLASLVARGNTAQHCCRRSQKMHKRRSCMLIYRLVDSCNQNSPLRWYGFGSTYSTWDLSTRDLPPHLLTCASHCWCGVSITKTQAGLKKEGKVGLVRREFFFILVIGWMIQIRGGGRSAIISSTLESACSTCILNPTLN